MATFWNTHGRITPLVAQAHIVGLLSVSPPVTIPSPFEPTPPTTTTATETETETDAPPARAPLDTPDEHALRALLLGITHRAAGHPAEARKFLRDAHARHARIPSTGGTWIGGVALFELAVLELREAQRLEQHEGESEGTITSSSSNSSSSSNEDVGVYGTRGLHVRVNALAHGAALRALE